MKRFLLLLMLFSFPKTYGNDETHQWHLYDERQMYYIMGKLANDSYVGLKCGLSVYSYLLGFLSIPDYEQTTDLNFDNDTIINLPVCLPEDKDWLLKGLREIYTTGKTLISKEVFTTFTVVSTLFIIKYGKSPYGGTTIYEMIISSISIEDFLNKLWTIPAPSFSDVTIGAVFEELVFRLGIQYSVYFISKIGLGILYNDLELIESHSNIFSIFIAASSFGLFHLLNPNPQIVQVLLATLAGVYLGSIFVNNGIIASSICHSVFNGSMLLFRATMLQLLFIIPKAINWYSHYRLPYPIQEAGNSAKSIMIP